MISQNLKNKFAGAAGSRKIDKTLNGLKKLLEFFRMYSCSSLIKPMAIHRLLPLRKRYFTTKRNTLRLRYVAGSCAAVCCAALLTFVGASETFAFKDYSDASTQSALILDQEYHAAQADNDAISDILKTKVSSGIRKASLALQKPDKPRLKTFEVKSGDTVAGLLQQAGLQSTEAYYAVKALNEYYDVRKVKSGQKIDVHFKPAGEGQMEFAKMTMKLGPVKEVNVTRTGPADFEAQLDEKELFPRQYARKAKIKTSLYGSAELAKIPPSVITEMIRIYSWSIDFQRDIRSGDGIEVLYEAFETEDGAFAKYGDVLYANLTVGGRDYPIYRYEMDNGRVDYFEPDGISIRKTLMKTPIDGARISSGFGMRRHPVLGYNKMHKGMDFAAPTGTPIYAAGDGVIEYAGRHGGYGNYVRIRHNSKLKTAYAHMHKIKVKNGTRVKQGEVIGTVGTTGRSTGPHLHYEVLVHNKQENPTSVKLPTGEQLAGKELQRFKDMIGGVYQQYVSLSEGLKYAFVGDADSKEIH